MSAAADAAACGAGSGVPPLQDPTVRPSAMAPAATARRQGDRPRRPTCGAITSVAGLVPAASRAPRRRRAAPTAAGRAAMLPRTSCSRASRSPAATSKHELVVHLQQHPRRAAPGLASAACDPQHGHLDDVGRRPLDRGVQRHPLGHLPSLAVVARQVGQVAAAAEHRLGVPGAPGLVDDARAGSRARRRTRSKYSSISPRASLGVDAAAAGRARTPTGRRPARSSSP